jgi:hypothetical protein
MMFSRRSSASQPFSRAEKRLFALCGIIIAVSSAWAYLNAPPQFDIPEIQPLPKKNGFDVYRAADAAIVNRTFLEDFVSFPAKQKPQSHSLKYQKKWLMANARAQFLFKQAQALPCRYPAKNWLEMGMQQFPSYRLRDLKKMENRIYLSLGDSVGAFNVVLDLVEKAMDESHGASWVGLQYQRLGTRQACRLAPTSLKRLDLPQTKSARARLEGILAKRESFSQVLNDMRAEDLSQIRAGMNGERDYGRGWRHLYTDTGSCVSENPNTPQQELALYLTSKRVFVSLVEELHKAARHEANKPYAQTSVLPDKAFCLRAMRSGLIATRFNDVTTRTMLDLLRVELALHEYFLEHGRYPTALNELSGHYFKKIPVDPFSPSSKNFCYRKKGNAYRIYSVGPDQKDDGGQAVFVKDMIGGYSTHTDSKGDFVPNVNS